MTHNVYTFNATMTCNKDKRIVHKIKVSADASNLDAAWDKAERKIMHDYPDHTYDLSCGNRQPMGLRPAVKGLNKG